jgi:hypothetical protein
MSKLLNTMLKVADSGFESKAEVMMVSDYVKSDKKTLLDKEMVKNMNTASDTLNESFDRFDEKFKKLVLDEVKMVEKTKLFAQKAKDYTNQVGESMARIDKVLVKDFEVKLDLLERYVKAMEALSDLNQKGFLTKLSQSIK